MMLCVMNCHGIERSCVKALLSLLYSGSMHVTGQDMKGAPVLKEFLQFLFGERAQMTGWRSAPIVLNERGDG